MEKSPLVTVVTGYYNRKGNLKECISSVLNQSYTNIEYIVFDDCSTDGTTELLEQFDEDSRFKLIKHKENLGFVKGLIRTVSKARGKYIAINGAGDAMNEHLIEKQVKVLEENSKIGLVSCYYSNNVNKNLIDVKKAENGLDFKISLRKKNFISHGGTMYRKDLYDKVGGYREVFTYGQDFDLWHRFSLYSNYYIIEEVLYHRNNDDKKAVTNSPMKVIKQIILADFAKNLVLKREKVGFDYVDLLGIQALALRKKTRSVTNSICYTIIKSLVQGVDKGLVNKMFLILKEEKKTMISRLMILVEKGVVNPKKILSLKEKIKNNKIVFLLLKKM